MAVPSEKKSVAENGPMAITTGTDAALWFFVHAAHAVSIERLSDTIRYACLTCKTETIYEPAPTVARSRGDLVFQNASRKMLRERLERFLHLVDLKAPDSVLVFSGGHCIRAIVYALGPDVLADVGSAMIRDAKLDADICPHCPEEREVSKKLTPRGHSWGMCDVCLKSVEDDDALAREAEIKSDDEPSAPVAPSSPSSLSPSPTGTPERDGSGVPPAGEEKPALRDCDLCGIRHRPGYDNTMCPVTITAMHVRGFVSAAKIEAGLRTALGQLKPILPGSAYLIEEAIAQLDRIPSLESQVTDLQAQRDMAANRRREFIASVEELIERWARS